MSHRPRTIMIAIVLLVSGGCSATQQQPAASQVQLTPPVTVLPAGAIADYQLGGAYPPPVGVTVVTRDSTAEPATGIYSICYVNGFQTQPGVSWPSDLVLRAADGTPLIDENWPDENILDIGTTDTRSRIGAIIGDTIRSCAAQGFQAVEFDNFDSYTRSDGQLNQQDAILFATELVEIAHGVSLAAGQKNGADLVRQGRQQVGFDFAVVEECDQFQECANFTETYGNQVIDVEYSDSLRRPFEEFCADPEHPGTTVLRDRNLVPVGSPEYVLDFC